MLFEVAGPIELKRFGSGDLITNETLYDLRDQLEALDKGLSQACGCYVFAIRAGPGFTPHYVGQSCARSIADEALNPSNQMKCNIILAEGKGTPAPGGRYRRQNESNSKLTEVIFLERWLIAKALAKNPDLINNKETRFLRELRVRGIFNAQVGEATKASSLLKQALE